MSQNRYIIITPAHNEEAFIAKTAESMIAQTIRPVKWVVVNDASQDRTREIMEGFAREHSFIELVNLERAAGRHFGNKVRAFNAGLERVKDLQFDFIGNLDADISFEPTYFESVLKQFATDTKLGLAGGMVHSFTDGEYVSQEVALDSVAGAVQLFRRDCFERVGGYRPLPNGGIDAAAEIAARMYGWTTRTFAEFPVKEHRLTGSATARPLASRVKEGRRMHSLGYGLLFFLFRCLYRSMTKPVILGSGAALYGYVGSVLSRSPVALPPDVVRFLRNEQRGKLKRAFGLKTN
jgi:glycosyltransferase involved in cell wall biosynthesis